MVIQFFKKLLQDELEDWKQVGRNFEKKNLERTTSKYIEAVKKRPLYNLLHFIKGFMITAIIIMSAVYINDNLRVCTGEYWDNAESFELTMSEVKRLNGFMNRRVYVQTPKEVMEQEISFPFQSEQQIGVVGYFPGKVAVSNLQCIYKPKRGFELWKQRVFS